MIGRCIADFAAEDLLSGALWPDFGQAVIRYRVHGQPATQFQRMGVAALAVHRGIVVALGSELLGGRIFADRDLIVDPVYTYKMVLAEEDHALRREYMPARPDSDTIGRNEALFEECRLAVPLRPGRSLATLEELAAAVDRALPIVALCAFPAPADAAGIDIAAFPISFFSIVLRPDTRLQGETGPVLLPPEEGSVSAEMVAEAMIIAHAFFNRTDEVEYAAWSAHGEGSAPSRVFRAPQRRPAVLSFRVPADG